MHTMYELSVLKNRDTIKSILYIMYEKNTTQFNLNKFTHIFIIFIINQNNSILPKTKFT